MQAKQSLLQTIRLTPLPIRVSGVVDFKVDLNGTWNFSPAPSDDFYKHQNDSNPDGWRDIQVPGEWAMQGFEVRDVTAAGYRREFNLPDSWSGKRIKLKCDGIYSDARIWINGQEAGAHLGGFTAFELDITRLTQPGKNSIAISVRSDSIADKLASGIKYAAHDLGGITRKIYLMAVPKLNVADVYVRTVFDKDYRDAKLSAQVRVANESEARIENADIELVLREDVREIQTVVAKLAAIEPGAVVTQEITLEVDAPRKWDAEHPNLYDLACSLAVGGKTLESVVRRVGFRQIEVRGNQVYINNHPVKLRGVNRHEMDPLRGRSLIGDVWRKDAELFREMNCNLIRTSHYPPPEELLHACDELGMFVEVEAPFCWACDNGKPEALDYTIQAEIETVLRDRSHACVILWSVANESALWDKNFEIAHRDFMRALDSTRPYLFEISSATKLEQNPSCVDVDVLHYPGLPGTELAAKNPRPLFFGEFAHLNVYNRAELLTDPGLRDVWGLGVAEMWERMLASPGCLGGAIWSGIDDLFVMPKGGAVGYGEWGPVDGWRRPRPEYWHLKKIFSPVRIPAESVAMSAKGGLVELQVENRSLFSDLNEVRFEWSAGTGHGEARASARPGDMGTLVIQAGESNIKTLELKAFDSRGFMLDAWRFPVGEELRIAEGGLLIGKRGEPRVAEGGLLKEIGDWRLAMDDSGIRLDEIGLRIGRKLPISLRGPALMLLPLRKEPDSKVSVGGQQNRYLPEGLRKDEDSKMPHLDMTAPFNACCTDWQPGTVSACETEEGIEVRVAGKYKEAAGEFTLCFCGDGKLRISYDFVLSAEITPRQTGLVFGLPRGFDTLAWRRKAQWSVYPEDHIGRPEGLADALPTAADFEYRSAPAWCWAHDCTAGGSNDFRSTKFNILEASLANGQSGGLRVFSDGRQHVRAWIDGDAVYLLVADFANEGTANFFNEYILPRPKLQPGEHVKGVAIIELFNLNGCNS